jgi:microsomal dipeptidase-like Zn-dependent dipeptidase/gamma-glutamyl-gamma-aminobutyrate hydrolase PuuD
MNIDRVHLSDVEALYSFVDSFVGDPIHKQPPCIGISANLKDGLSCIAQTYVQAITQAGGVPVLIPVTTDLHALSSVLNHLDGILMSGGGDINPLYCNEDPILALQDVNVERDMYDLMLIRLAVSRQLPFFGICRGMQLLAVALGGAIFQDIYAQAPQPPIKHSQTVAREYPSHRVTTTEGSRVRAILGDNVAVNSFHHQAIQAVPETFVATAHTSDGVIEAMESALHPTIWGVQWHPESMATAGDKGMQKLFHSFVSDTMLYKQAKEIHQRIVTIDSHCDTPMLFRQGATLQHKSVIGKVNVPLMEEGYLDAACIVAYLSQKERDEQSLVAATNKAIVLLRKIHTQVTDCGERAAIAYTSQDLFRNKRGGKKSFMIGIENGYAIGKELSNLEQFKALGVTYITLCHNGNNDICDSAKGTSEWNGLSDWGKTVVHEMNRLGIMIDISHAADQTVWDVLEESKYPIIASHSSARALCNHKRNLTDEQIIAIAQKGGVMQVCLYSGFLTLDGRATVEDAVNHILHIRDIVGIDHVGIGSDFDGGGGIDRCNTANELINLTQALLQAGLSESDLQKLWGGNFMRVMDSVQAAYKI